MNDDLHKIDDLFITAYRQFEDEPPPAAWEQIKSALDKKDAEKYKRNFIGWKRIAILLLLLLSVLVLYEFRSGIKKSRDNQLDLADKAKKPAVAASNKQNINPEIINSQHKAPPIKNDDSNSPVSSSENEINLTAKREKIIGRASDKKTGADIYSSKKSRQTGISLKNNATAGLYEKGGHIYSYEEDNLKKANSLTGTMHRETAVDKILPGQEIDLRITEPIQIQVANPAENLVRNFTPGPPAGRAVPILFPLNSMKLPALHRRQDWSLAAIVSTDLGMYLLDDNVRDRNGNLQDEKNEITSREKHEASFSASMLLTRQFSNRVIIKAGLMYANTAIGINPQNLYATQQSGGGIAYKYNTSSGYSYVKPAFNASPAVGDSIQTNEARHNLQSLSILLMTGHNFERDKFSFTPSAGLSVNYITRATLQTEVKDALHREIIFIDRLSGTRNFYIGFIADVNVQYKMSNRWSLNLLPSFRFALTPITKSNVVKTYPYSFGLGAGVSYSL